MNINAEELRECIIHPVLNLCGDYSLSAETLLLGTAAQQSQLEWFFNANGTNTYGIYQITPNMHQAVWDEYLINDENLASSIRGLASQRAFLKAPHEELAVNLNYTTAIAWLHYKKSGVTLPSAFDIPAMAQQWQKAFGQHSKALKKDFCGNFYRFIERAEIRNAA